ncbi:MAG: Aspartyl-tRNA synthetase [Candidatus Amesbacteria bacterium GW2011_GWB1_47_26]|nr:MAG: Aspartyl-tRNA synthetase [Candidatus Amesbacteria bacterium GW2011_GWB1_47_26]
MSVYDQIIQLLKSNDIKYQTLEHEPTPTCEDSARVRGTSPGQGAKALICYADKKPILIVHDLRFATPDEVLQLTGLQIGAIPPLGNLFNLPTYIDQALSAEERIAFNAGDRAKSVIMSYSDYAPLAQAQDTGHVFSQPK